METCGALTVSCQVGDVAASPSAGTPTALAGLRRVNLALGSLGFLLLTVGIVWYQFHRIQGGDAGPDWAHLRWRYLGLILLCLPVETLTAGVRMWVVCRTLEARVRLWTCVKAEWANVALNLLTPSHSGGGAGQIYMLARDGVRAGTALTISVLGFLGTMVGLLAMGLYALFVSGRDQIGPLFATTVGALACLACAMLLAATWPGAIRRVLGGLSRAFWRLSGGRHPLEDWSPLHAPRSGDPVDRLDRFTARLVDLVYTYREDVRRFLRVGKVSFAWVCLLSFGFLFSRALMAYLCLRFLGIETSTFRHVMETQMVVVFVIFFAPTPGGAGLAEGASLSIMAGIVPVGFAPYYNLLWRCSTAYLGAMAGLFCLARALLQDARRVVRRTPIEGRIPQ